MKFVPGPLKIVIDQEAEGKPIRVHHPEGVSAHDRVCLEGKIWIERHAEEPIDDNHEVYIEINVGAEVD